MADIRTVALPSGERVPALGQGTWYMAEDAARRSEEIASLRLGLDLGLTLIDTAEMYADGASETLVGEAVAGRREEVFLVSKVMPGNAGRDATIRACERSLGRLGTDRIDLYLLHWRGGTPLAETVDAIDRLVWTGKIRHWGVSNFDPDDMAELEELPGGKAVATNQVLYNLTRRGIEYDLLPHCRAAGIPVMAYSPLDQGRILRNPTLGRVAARHGATPAQIGLAWLTRQDGLIAIPKTGRPAHLRENRASFDVTLTPEDLVELDRAFPPPSGPLPLEML